MSHPVLGYDPAPGDPAAVRLLAQTFGAAAEDAESISARLRRIGPGAGDAVWRGPAAESFHTLLAEVGPDVIRLASAHREAQDALVHYAAELERAQDIGRRAESDAARATGERDRAAQLRRQAAEEAADRDREAWACRTRIAESQAQRLLWAADPAYQAELQRYETQVRARQQQAETQAVQARGRERSARTAESAAGAHIRAAELLGEQAREVRDAAARHTVDRLDRAGQQGQRHRSVVERLLTAADDLGRKIVTSPTFEKFMGHLDAAALAFGILSLAAVAFFPPAAPILGVAATALGILSFLGTAAGHRYGTRSTGDLVWSAVGMVPLVGKGAVLGGKLIRRLLPTATAPVARAISRVKGSRPVTTVVRWADETRERVRPLQNFRADHLYDLGYTTIDVIKRAEPLIQPRILITPLVRPLPGPSRPCPEPLQAAAR